MNAIHYISLLVIPVFLLATVIYGVLRKVSVYDSFISGAKEGPGIVLRIFPYLAAIFVAIKGFQASGAFDLLKTATEPVFSFFNVPLEVISISIIKPLSGSASTAVFTDIVKTTGPDSLATRISAVIMGSAETTFYVIAVYLGAVNIKKTRYLLPVCLAADVIGIIVAIITVKLIF